MKVGLTYKGKKVIIDNIKKCNDFEKYIGLMFSRREKSKSLLFEFDRMSRTAIHSFFVFFPFVAVWIDNRGKIIEIRKISSWRISIKPEKNFVKLIEIPVNQRYNKIIALLDGD